MSIMNLEQSLKPILKYPGGKVWIAKGIRYLYQSTGSSSFYEPFAGGLSVCLHLGSPCSIINDINPHVINFYRAIRDGMTFDLEWENSKDYYYAARDRFNLINKQSDAGGFEAAKLYYFLNRACYNGLNRWSKIKKNFNVPQGKYNSLTFRADFAQYKKKILSWEIRNEDFSITLANVRGDALIYLDPPYHNTFVNYTSDGFSWLDQVRVVESVRGLDNPIVISNSWTPEIVSLYRSEGFIVNKVKVSRYISKGPRTPAYEVVAFRGVSAYHRKTLLWFKGRRKR